MSRTIIHYAQDGSPRWGVQFGQRIATSEPRCVQHGRPDLQALGSAVEPRRVASHHCAPQRPTALTRHAATAVHLPRRELPQPHRGVGPEHRELPVQHHLHQGFLQPHAADAPVVRPAHVHLLDYEIELGLVLRRPIPAGTQVTANDLSQWVAGVTIVNDLSARDVQLPQGQFYKGKSYRGFGPVGPTLVLLTPQEWHAGRSCAAPDRQRPAAAGRLLRRNDPRPGSNTHRTRSLAGPEPRRPDRHGHAGRLRSARARQADHVHPAAFRQRSGQVADVHRQGAQQPRPTCVPATHQAHRSAPTMARSIWVNRLPPSPHHERADTTFHAAGHRYGRPARRARSGGRSAGQSAGPLRRARAGHRQGSRHLREAARDRAGQRGAAHPPARRCARG